MLLAGNVFLRMNIGTPTKLPHNSGRVIIDLETDPAMQHIVETLVETGKERVDRVAWSLSELLQVTFRVRPNLICSLMSVTST